MTDKLDKTTRAQLAQQLLNRFLDQVDIDDRLAQIEERLDAQASNIAEAHRNHTRLCIRVTNLENRFDTLDTIREGQANSLDQRLDKIKDALANHDARLSDLEGEDRKVVLETNHGNACAPRAATFQRQLVKLGSIRDRIRGYWSGKETSEELADDLAKVIGDLYEMLGFGA